MATDNDIRRYAEALGVTEGEAKRRVTTQESDAGEVVNMTTPKLDEVTLVATIQRIKRVAHILELDLPKSGRITEHIGEIKILSDIALRCLDADDA
jgi:hypothetical protein